MGKNYVRVGETSSFKEKEAENWGSHPKVHVLALIHSIKEVPGLNHVIETFPFQPEKCGRNGEERQEWKATLVHLNLFHANSFDDLQTEQEQWLFFLKHVNQLNALQMKKLEETPFFQQGLQHLRKISSDPQTIRDYKTRMNDLRDEIAIHNQARKTGYHLGYLEATKEGAFHKANQMFEKDTTVQEVVDVTELFEEEARLLQNEVIRQQEMQDLIDSMKRSAAYASKTKKPSP